MEPTQPPKKLLDRLREILRTQHYSSRTEQTYVEWAKRFILFHHKRHPKDMGAPEVEVFLTHLALERKVAASTQNQASPGAPPPPPGGGGGGGRPVFFSRGVPS